MRKKHPQIQHTIDNLCPDHASKVADMLKQLSDLRRRCTALEAQLASVSATHSDLTRVNAEMEESITSEEDALWDATQRSCTHQETIRSLAIQHQHFETEASSLRLRVAQEQKVLDDRAASYRHLRWKYDKIHKDAGFVFRPDSCEASMQTDALPHVDAGSRARLRGSVSSLSASEEESDNESIDDETVTMIWTLSKH
jgi:prefoldin subunit 5